MNKDTVLAAVESIVNDPAPSPSALRWIRQGFQRHLETGQPLTTTLGITACCPNGIAKAWRDRQFRLHLSRALAFIPATGTTHSRARILREELLRTLRRPGRNPRTELELHLQAAIRVNPNPKISIPNLWKIIDGIQKGGLLFDENLVNTDNQLINEGEYLGIQSRKV